MEIVRSSGDIVQVRMSALGREKKCVFVAKFNRLPERS